MAEQSIVVGVTGVGENDDALRYAAEVAASTGAGVTLVHVDNPVLPPVPMSTRLPREAWDKRGADVVEAVRADFARIAGDGIPVDVAVEVGDPGWVLGERSTDASLVVLQHRSLKSLTRIFTGSTVATAAAQARCPVVSVPAGHTPRANGLVVVGVLDDGGPREVVETAVLEADRRHSGLRLVHGWRLAPDYDDLLVNDEAWIADLESGVRSQAHGLAEKYPDVPMQVDVRHHWPADILVEASKEADLLVIGRHQGRRLMPPRLGGTGRAVVQHADCAVMIVPV
jgi:nucleotide-binding universal stress UspA family protein